MAQPSKKMKIAKNKQTNKQNNKNIYIYNKKSKQGVYFGKF